MSRFNNESSRSHHFNSRATRKAATVLALSAALSGCDGGPQQVCEYIDRGTRPDPSLEARQLHNDARFRDLDEEQLATYLSHHASDVVVCRLDDGSYTIKDVEM